MLKANKIVVALSVLVLTSCNPSGELRCDLKLVPSDNYGEVHVNLKNAYELVFNVNEIEDFNYAHIMFEDRFFITNHRANGGFLILNKKTLIPKDTVNQLFARFSKQQSFKIILGKKKSEDSNDLGINAVLAVSVTVDY